MSDRKFPRQELRESLEKIENALRNAPEGIDTSEVEAMARQLREKLSN